MGTLVPVQNTLAHMSFVRLVSLDKNSSWVFNLGPKKGCLEVSAIQSFDLA